MSSKQSLNTQYQKVTNKTAGKLANPIRPMQLGERIGWAAGILILDFIIFFLPITALITFAVILARPEFFKAFVDRLYAE